jgi:hypothetical protein
MRKKMLMLALFSMTSLAAAHGANAFMTEEQKTQRKNDLTAARETKQEERTQKKEAGAEQRCAMIQERIQNRIGNFDDKKDMHMAVYANMVDRISKFIEKLSGEGYDTAKIKADLETLQEKIAKFSTDKDARLAALNETKSFACGHSDGEFKAKLAEARKALQLVRADAMDIRKYMLTIVRPDIQALNKQRVETKSAANGTKPELE